MAGVSFPMNFFSTTETKTKPPQCMLGRSTGASSDVWSFWKAGNKVSCLQEKKKRCYIPDRCYLKIPMVTTVTVRRSDVVWRVYLCKSANSTPSASCQQLWGNLLMVWSHLLLRLSHQLLSPLSTEALNQHYKRQDICEAVPEHLQMQLRRGISTNSSFPRRSIFMSKGNSNDPL